MFEKSLRSHGLGGLLRIAAAGLLPALLFAVGRSAPLLAQGDADCLACHEGTAAKHAFHPDMGKPVWAKGGKDLACATCHVVKDPTGEHGETARLSDAKLVETCGRCHAAAAKSYRAAEHGKARAAGVVSAPNCVSCHRNGVSEHARNSDPLAVKVAQEKLCLSCHLDDPRVRVRTHPSAKFVAAYEESVHGKALLGGEAAAANCVSCHGAHEVRTSGDAAAKVNRLHVAETCAECHGGEAEAFAASVHGRAVAKGNVDAPVCTNCHGEHGILSPKNPKSPVAAANVAAMVCQPCHASVALSEKYGIAADRFQTFTDSFHGLALRGGSVAVANCASCHGAHDILPSREKASRVHKENLAKTCGSCHPGANARFAVGTVHVSESKDGAPVLYLISTLYLVLIGVVVGGMGVHNLLDFVKKARRRVAIRAGAIEEEPAAHRLYVRMTLAERLQHGALMASFTLLVVTGFMLRYPEAWWVEWIRRWSDRVFDARSLVHRISAVVMCAASAYHLYYVLFTERGRALIRDLWPRLQDARDAVAVLRYNLGLSPAKPRFGRFSYVEKSEYWALVWGTLLMAATGFVMWFDNTFIGLFTKLGYDVARTIHFYEAWLATLAIVVWHLYFVVFNPDAYPMNVAWLTGKLSEREMQEEHPLELEAIHEEERRREEAERAAREAAAREAALRDEEKKPDAP